MWKYFTCETVIGLGMMAMFVVALTELSWHHFTVFHFAFLVPVLVCAFVIWTVIDDIRREERRKNK